MNWKLIIDNGARKQLKRIPKSDVERIMTAIEELIISPYAGDIEKMEGEESAWRRRIGAYRIFYEIHSDKKIIYVFEIKRRTSTTY